ncbi:MAG: butyrate kinase [Spirochaetota bacterium]
MGTARQLIINPGSITTKLSVWDGLEELYGQTITHERQQLEHYTTVALQEPFRLACVERFLEQHGADIHSFDLIMGRGGLLRPLRGGVYLVTEAMVADLKAARYGEHASNLGAVLAFKLAKKAGCPAYIADPVVVDELIDDARLSGLQQLPRKSIFHALNQKIAARQTAEALGRPYEELQMIVAHLGGGISIGAHKQGRVVDVNNALDGEGPFTPQRSGTLPAGDLIRLCFSGAYTQRQLEKLVCGQGGVISYLGTSDMQEVLRRAYEEGDTRAAACLQAMIYQCAKEIGALSVTLGGAVDAIVITGGMAHSPVIVDKLKERVACIAPVFVIPGEREMLSLAENGQAVYDGSREVLAYE